MVNNLSDIALIIGLVYSIFITVLLIIVCFAIIGIWLQFKRLNENIEMERLENRKENTTMSERYKRIRK